MTTQNENEYFNVTMNAVGYVSKIIVRKEGRKETIKIRMNLLSGKKTAIKYIPAEFFVNGEKAINLVHALNDVLTEDSKILIAFVGNVYPSHYVSQAQGYEGVIVPTFAGSLNYIKSIKENGEFTYRDESLQNDGSN
jgi:NAD kinase